MADHVDYGASGSSFSDTNAKFQAQSARRQELVRKEAEARRASSQEITAAEDVSTAARREAADVAARETAVVDVQTKARTASIDVIRAEAAARRQNTAAAREESAAMQRQSYPGFGGTRVEQDPVTGRWRRAADNVAAREAASGGGGYRGGGRPPAPPGGGDEPPRGPYGPLTRVQAATQGKAQADAEVVRANRAYAASLRGVDSELQARLLSERLAAQAVRKEATAELKAAQEAEATAAQRVAERNAAAQTGYSPRTASGAAHARLLAGGGPITASGQAHAARIAAADAPAPPVDARVVQQAEQESAAAGAVQRATVARREAAASFSQLDTAMYRHGALTSEFIQATLKGETTIRDLGSQVAITTGKFAGWTAAAAGVYAVIGAVAKFAEGATQAQNGAQNLSRFVDNLNKNAAISGFQSTSRDLNVSISDVADATSSFARVFHSLPAAQTAARASLILTKLDNISAADSYRALTATVLGFKLSANDVPAVVDRINATQRRFGAKSSEIVAGLARSAGPLGISGVGYQQDIALLGTGILAGQTGPVVGNALARSATNFVHKAPNRAILESFGLDPNQNYGDLINQAMATILAKNLNPEQIRQLAVGFGGPQLGSRVFTALFSNPQRYQAIQAHQITPDEKATSELQIKLHSVGEEAKSVGIALENMGAGLAKSGILTVVSALFAGLAGVLHVGTDILGVFGKLPDAVKIPALALGGLAGATLLARRFAGPTGGVLSRIPGLSSLDNPDRRTQRALVTGLGGERAQIAAEAEGYSRTAARARIEQEATARARTTYISGNRAAATAPEGSEARVSYQDELNRYQAQETAAIRQGAVAAEQEKGARQAAVAVDAEITKIKEMSAAEARRYAVASDVALRASYRNPDLNNLLRGATIPGRVDTQRYYPGGAPIGAMTEAETLAADRGLTSKGAAVEARMKAAQASLRDFAGMGTTVGKSLDNLAITGVSRGVSTLDRGAARAGAAISGLKSVPGKLSGSLSTLVGGLGALDLAFIAFAGFEVVTQLADNIRAHEDAAAKASAAQATSLQQQRDQANAYARRGGNGAGNRYTGGSVFEGGNLVTNARASVRRGIGNLSDVLHPTRFLDPGYESTAQRELDQQANDKANRDVYAAQRREQAAQRARGGPVANQYLGDIQNQVNKDVQDYKNGLITFAQLKSDFAKHAIEIKGSANISGADVKKGMQALATAQASVAATASDYATSIRGMDNKQLQAEITTQLRALKGYGGGSKGGRESASHLATLYAEIGSRTFDPNADEAQRDAFAQASETITQGIIQQAQDDLKDNLALSTSNEQRQRAYDLAIRSVQQRGTAGPNKTLAAVRQKYEDDVKRQSEAESALRNARDPSKAFDPPSNPLDPQLPGGLQSDSYRKAEASYKSLQEKAKGTRALTKQAADDLRKAREAVVQARKDIAAAAADLKTQKFQDYTTGVDNFTAYLDSQTQDPFARYTNDLKAAREKVQKALDMFGATSREYRQSMTDLNNLFEQHYQDVTALADAQYTATIAGQSGDAMAQATSKVKQARYDMSRAQNPKDRAAAQASLNDAIYQAQQQAKQQQDDRLTYLASLTTDPLKKDQFDVKKAQNDVKGTKPGTSENYKALATLNDARSKYVDDKASSRESDIQFQLDMNQITTQEAVADLQHLLRLGNLSKQRKQEIESKIHELQKQGSAEASGFDLDVGSGVKLPTAYDVHRAFAGIHDSIKNAAETARGEVNNLHAGASAGRGGHAGATGGTAAPVHLDMKIYVSKAGDESKVYDQIDRALKTHVRARAKSLGRR